MPGGRKEPEIRKSDGTAGLLPARFSTWFDSRGWVPRPHQLELLEKAEDGRSALLIAPTGAGKTLAGFLPTLVDLERRPRRRPGEPVRGLHTLYVSPLKALAVDIARNLEAPIRDMVLPVSIETRTGDTSAHKRQRQKIAPPDVLMTTPEQVALLVASREAERLFADLKTVIFDELHALVTSKRGDLLSLGLARLRSLAPGLRAIGLSATVADPDALRAWLVPQETGSDVPPMADLVTVTGGLAPSIRILETDARIPWSGHSARYALDRVYEAIKAHRTTLVFVNTRSQAELIFQELWRINEDGLAIALHHGSLDVAQRRRVEAAMVDNELRAVVCTSTLDLGIDWGDVDLVVHVGAPKGASRLAQRIGRSNHRLDEPSKAILVPANRFEVMECRAALDANYVHAQDTPPIRAGALDVLAQHVLGMAVAAPFEEDTLYREITSAYPYRNLGRDTFGRALEFVATGGYALKTYERYAKIRRTVDGTWRLSHPMIAKQYRLNIGTIVEEPLLKVRLIRRNRPGPIRGGRVLGQMEEYFLETMATGDTFLFAGEVVRFEGIRENEAIVTRSADTEPRIPSYAGGKFPLSTYLADGVRSMLSDPATWKVLPDQVAEWLRLQRDLSVLPKRNELLVETFPRGSRFYLVAYPFEGRLAHQTLGMLLTRRLERARARPIGFVATDYAIAVWGLGDLALRFKTANPTIGDLFSEDMLGDDLEAWLDESYLLKRTFRYCALISGLIEKRHPGQEKSGRQVTVSSDLIYDVLRQHEPDHLL
ncbi:MAG: ligase-associated DNA damage response DEXH box helicase, partial [Pseudomonadota bacterium]